MPLVLSDPCESTTSLVSTGTVSIVAGRTGNAISISGTNARVQFNLSGAQESDTLTVGCALKLGTLNTCDVIQFRSDAEVTSHVTLRVNANGSFTVGRNNAAPFTGLVSSATGLVAAGTWYYVELQAKLSDTVGTAIVRLNGTDIINSTGLDTRNAGTKTVFDTVRFENYNPSTPVPVFDDVYIRNDATFMGDTVVPYGPGLILLDGLEDRSSLGAGTAASSTFGRNGIGVKDLGYNIPAAQQSDTITVGAAVRTGYLSGSTIDLISLAANASNYVRMSDTGQLSVIRLSATILGPSAAGTIPANTWVYLEIQIRSRGDTTGFVTVKVNGTTVLTSASIITQITTSNYTGLQMLTAGTGATGIDDLYIETGSGYPFLGDITVETLYPNGNGNASAWVGSDADSVNNYLLVDETGTPSSADYTGSATAGAQDLYQLTDLTKNGTIVGVCHQVYAAASDTAGKSLKLVNRRSADTKSPLIDLWSTTYAPLHYCLTTDPETGAAFTVANVNALQSGVEALSGTDVLLEPFNNFTDTPWTLTSTPTIVSGRTGTAASFTGTSQRADYNIATANQSDTITMGAAWRFTDSVLSVRYIWQLYSDNGTLSHNDLMYNPFTTTLTYTRGGSAIATNAAVTLTQNTWYYVEMQTRLHDTAGFVTVRINGAAPVLNVTSLDTKNAGTKTVYDQLRVWSNLASATGQYDDLYITMGAGGTFKGSIAL